MLIISLSTTPPNMFKLSGYLDKILKSQTVEPDIILVNVSEKYARFKRDSFFLSPKSLSDKIVINTCDDSGPATKLLGIFESDIKIYDDDTIIIIDDDISYPADMCADYIETFDLIKNAENTVLGVVGNKLEKGLTEWIEENNAHLRKVNALQGWGSYAMKGSAIKKLREAYSIHHFPDHVFYQDDLFLSNIMNKALLDLRVIQTKSMWSQRSVIDYSKADCPWVVETNLHLRPYHAEHQMRLDKSLGQKSNNITSFSSDRAGETLSGWLSEKPGDPDGNLIKNLRSLDLYIRKGIDNFNITEKRKKAILLQNFTTQHGDFIDPKDISDLPLFESIQYLEEMEKNIKLTNLCFDILEIEKGGQEEYTRDLIAFIERFGISKAIDKFLEKLPYKPRENKKRKAAVIFHIPMDGTHGCQARAMASIRALISLGFEVHLFSKNHKDPSYENHVWGWKEEDAEKIKQEGVKVLDIFDPPENEPFTSPTWSKHVQEKIKDEDYDFIVTIYEHTLTPETYKLIKKYPSVIETQDDVHFSGLLQNYMNSNKLDSLEEIRRFYSNRRLAESSYDFKIPKIFISEQELESLGSRTDCFIPHVAKPSISEKSFKGNPIFVGSDNVFNKHGLDFLNSSVDFPLDIIGHVSLSLSGPINENLNLRGVVENTSDIYSAAPFSVCPLTLGTGSKIKIQESLANATPVVSMIDSGLASDIIHNINGFLCYTFEEFAEYCNLLNSDRDLCSEMGKAAARMNAQKQRITFEEYFEIITKVGGARRMIKRKHDR